MLDQAAAAAAKDHDDGEKNSGRTICRKDELSKKCRKGELSKSQFAE